MLINFKSGLGWSLVFMQSVKDDYLTLGIMTIVVIVGIILSQFDGLMVYIIGTTILIGVSLTLLFVLVIVSTSVYFNKKAVADMKPSEFLGKNTEGRKPKMKRSYKDMGISL